jgi:hypothetical protein
MCGTKRCAVAKDKGKLYFLTNKMAGVGANGCAVFIEGRKYKKH